MKKSLFEPLFVIPILGLSGFSLSIIQSTNPTLFLNQLFFYIMGIFLYILFSQIDYRLYTKNILLLYIFSLILLSIVFWGPHIRGATRWIDLFGFRLQTAEVLKPFIFIIISTLLSSRPISKLTNLLFIIFTFFPFLFLIFKQPDLGNVLVYLGIFVSLLLNAGLSFRLFFFLVVSFILLLPQIWLRLYDYQKARITSFLDPITDPQGTGYNSLQAVIAIGGGGLLGLGLGRGTQSHLQFLPEFHTDFAFASLVEEFGFIGGVAVIIFYSLLLYRLFRIILRTRDLYPRLLCLALFSQILVQVIINIGMNLRLLPITGITLPLISYGGSSIMGIFISLGITQSVKANTFSSFR